MCLPHSTYIIYQLSSDEIEFDDEIRVLIMFSSLPDNWEAMQMAASNSAGRTKLKYNDICGLIVAEEGRKKDLGEVSGFNLALILILEGEDWIKTQTVAYQNPNIGVKASQSPGSRCLSELWKI